MGHFWTVAPYNENAITNTSRLKYKKKSFLILVLGEGKLTIKNKEKQKFIPYLESPLVKMTGAVSFSPP